jgi:hypothetical protein
MTPREKEIANKYLRLITYHVQRYKERFGIKIAFLEGIEKWAFTKRDLWQFLYSAFQQRRLIYEQPFFLCIHRELVANKDQLNVIALDQQPTPVDKSVTLNPNE